MNHPDTRKGEVSVISGRNIAVALCLLAVFSTLLAQPYYPAFAHGGPNDDRASSLVEAGNGGYVLAGWTRSFGNGTPGARNLLTLKTDPQGIPQRAVLSVGAADEEARSMVRTLDGGYALTGITNSYGAGGTDAFVLKLDANLNQQWCRVYGTGLDDTANSIIQTLDGGYALCGWTVLMAPGQQSLSRHIFVSKLDPAGFPQWTNIYWFSFGGPNGFTWEYAHSIAQAPSGSPVPGYVVVGKFGSVDTLDPMDGYCLRLDPMGNVLLPVSWIIGPDTQSVQTVVYPNAAGYTVAGFAKGYWQPPTAAKALVAQFTPQGVPVWNRLYGYPTAQDERIVGDHSLIMTQDNGFALAGWTRSVGPGTPQNPNFLMLKLNPGGNLIWGREHPSQLGPNREEAFSIIQQSNLDYAVAGWTNSFGQGGDDFHFLTLNNQLSRPYCVRDTAPDTASVYVTSTVFESHELYFRLDTSMTVESVAVAAVGLESICVYLPTGLHGGSRLPGHSGHVAALVGHGRKVELLVPCAGDAAIALFDASGRLAYSERLRGLQPGGHDFAIPALVGAGLYVLRVKVGQELFERKLVIW